ncbi:LysR family transcriptional regulator [Nocardia beijingensis]|uniref:LysR family transcriptional regulator n=1 Tax=Nocardia beijingensis TaxID=95162 RepID=UPI003325384D
MPLNGVDLNLLVALDALLAEGNVTRAAERTSVGQPAMSASLARLRKHFDDPLLVKDGRRLVLTPMARSLIEPVRAAINAVDGVLGARATFDPATLQRSFTIAASDYVNLVLLRPLFARLTECAPGVRITVVPLPVDFADQLRRQQIELLIMPTALAGSDQDFPSARLFSERFVLACANDNPDIGEEIAAEQLSKLPYLSYRVGPLQGLGESELEEIGVERNVEVRTQSFVVVPFLLPGTRLISLLQKRLFDITADRAQVRMLEPPAPLRPAIEAMYWNPRQTEDPAHRWLRRQIADLAAGLR